MKYFLKITFAAWACLLTMEAQAQDAHKWLLKGDKAYEDKNFSEAEVNYRRALEKDNSAQGAYNLGNSTYRQERYDEAVRHYESVTESARDNVTRARAFHNLGNAHFQNQKYKESIDAYKNALRLNPDDMDTRRNLVNALRRLPPPPPPQSQQGDSQQQKDQNQQQNQQQQQQQNQSPQQDPQDNENQDENDQQQQQPSSGQQEQPQDLSKEEARQLLEIMDQEEQKVQQKLRKAQAKNKKSSKDW